MRPVNYLLALIVCVSLALITYVALVGYFKEAGPLDSTAADENINSSGSDVITLTRGDRYGEIVLVRRSGIKFEAEIWGTQGLNDCPAASWEALDSEAIRSETNALGVVMNGPRYWLPNSIEGALPSPKRRKFGELEMRYLATIEIRPWLGNAPYNERIVHRKAAFIFQKGEQVYELTSANGAVYVMLSMSQTVVADLKLAELPNLNARINLPAKWTFHARTLQADLVIPADSQAVVLQDELRNSYHRRPTTDSQN